MGHISVSLDRHADEGADPWLGAIPKTYFVTTMKRKHSRKNCQDPTQERGKATTTKKNLRHDDYTVHSVDHRSLYGKRRAPSRHRMNPYEHPNTTPALASVGAQGSVMHNLCLAKRVFVSS